MRFDNFRFICLLFVCFLTGCAGSRYHIESEEEIFKPAIKAIKRIIPHNIDLKIDAKSKGWDSDDYFDIQKITAVSIGSLKKKYCYTVLSRNDTCEAGVDSFQPLPSREYSVSLGLSEYNSLSSNKYNGYTGLWYKPGGGTRASWSFWSTHKAQILELAALSIKYISRQNTIASALNIELTELSEPKMPLVLGEQYTVEELKLLILANSTDEVVKERLIKWAAVKIADEKKAAEMAKSRAASRKIEAALWKKQRRKQVEAEDKLYFDKLARDQERWNRRLTVNWQPGDKVCTKNNRIGFVESISNDKVKVLIKGILLDEYSMNYFFGGRSRSEYKKDLFQTTDADDIFWYDKYEIAQCEFSFK